MKVESKPGPHLVKRSNLKKGIPFRLVAKPVVYEFPNGIRIGLTQWLN